MRPQVQKLGSSEARDDWGQQLGPMSVNAFYNVHENTLFLPAAMLQEPFFPRRASHPPASSSAPSVPPTPAHGTIATSLDARAFGSIGALLGHEMSHVANGDMVTLSLIQGIINAFVIFFSRVIGHFVDRVILKNERGYGIGYFFTVIFAQVILGILASTIVCWFSRRREFRADFGGAQLTSKEAMISSLRTLEKMSAAKLPDQMLAFGISNQGNSQTLRKLFSTHPPIRERILALENTNFSENLNQQQI